MSAHGLVRIGNTCYINAAIQSVLWSAGLGSVLNVVRLCEKGRAGCLVCALKSLKSEIESRSEPMSPLERLDPFLDLLVPNFKVTTLFDAEEFVQSLVKRLLVDSDGHSVAHSELFRINFYNWVNPTVGASANLYMPASTASTREGEKPTTTADVQELVESSGLSFVAKRPWTVFLSVLGPTPDAAEYNLDLEFPAELSICGFVYRLESIVKYHPGQVHYTAHRRCNEGWLNFDDTTVSQSPTMGSRWPRYAVYVDVGVQSMFMAMAYANVGPLMDPQHPAHTSLLYKEHIKSQIRLDMNDAAVDVDQLLNTAKKTKKRGVTNADALASSSSGQDILEEVANNIWEEARLSASATVKRVAEDIMAKERQASPRPPGVHKYTHKPAHIMTAQPEDFVFKWRGQWRVVQLLPRVGDLYVAGLERTAFARENEFNDTVQDRTVDQEEMNELFGMAKRRTLFPQNSTSGQIRDTNFCEIEGHELYSHMGYVSSLVPQRYDGEEVLEPPPKRSRVRKTISFQTPALPPLQPTPSHGVSSTSRSSTPTHAVNSGETLRTSTTTPVVNSGPTHAVSSGLTSRTSTPTHALTEAVNSGVRSRPTTPTHTVSSGLTSRTSTPTHAVNSGETLRSSTTTPVVNSGPSHAVSSGLTSRTSTPTHALTEAVRSGVSSRPRSHKSPSKWTPQRDKAFKKYRESLKK